MRMCVDYRALNKLTVKEHFPLPNIEDLFDQLQGARIFSRLDLQSGYHQLRIREKDIQKTAFVCPLGQFEYVCAPFGLCNLPSQFSRFMHTSFRDLSKKASCSI